MTQVSARDRARLRELERVLANLEEPAHGRRAVEQVYDVLGADVLGRFGLECDGDRILLKDIETADHVPKSYFRELEDGLASGRAGFVFSTRIPERSQRNRAVSLPPVHRLRAVIRDQRGGRSIEPERWRVPLSALQALAPGIEGLCALMERYGMANHFQLRTLICDGPLVLCYFNALQEQPFTRRQRQLYEAVIKLLARRARLEHRLASANVMRATLDVVLDSLGRTAFIVGIDGTVHHANRLGLEAIERRADLDVEILGAIQHRSADFEAHPILERGVAVRFLVLGRQTDLGLIVAMLATELDLNLRAEQVLHCAIDGESTKSIAMRLGLAENTVEYHLTRLFRRLGVRTRAELQRLVLERFIDGKRRE